MLWEGDRATLSVLDIETGTQRIVEPKGPEDIRSSVMRVIRSTGASAISVSCLPGSSLENAGDWFSSRAIRAVYFQETSHMHLTTHDVPVLDQRGSRS